MTTFKVGDKVRFKASERGEAIQHGLDPDLTYSVIRIAPGDDHDVLVVIGDNLGFYSRRLELAPPAPEPIRMDGQYQTRHGREVRILAVDLPGEYPVAGAITGLCGDITVNLFTADGHFLSDGTENNYDLIPVPPEPKEHEGWVAFIKCSAAPCGVLARVTQTRKEFAVESVDPEKIVAVIPFKFHEGEGL